MSYYRNKLQEALLHSPTHNPPTRNFYDVLEFVAYAAFLSGWLGAILAHV